MFKKPFTTKSYVVLRSSERRRICQEIVQQYPHVFGAPDKPLMTVPADVEVSQDKTVDAANDGSGGDMQSHAHTLALAIPDTSQSTKFKSHAGDRGVIYCESGSKSDPLWLRVRVDDSGQERLVPSVYTLWKHPELLPVITTYMPVISKLISGADLMIPGIVVPQEGIPDVKKGDLVSVCALGYGLPLAVGVMATDSTPISNGTVKAGKGVLIVHTYKDFLWESGSNPSLPQGGRDPPLEPRDDIMPAAEVDADDNEVSKDRTGEEEPSACSPEEMDEALLVATVRALATGFSQRGTGGGASELPISISEFYSQHVIPNAPSCISIDVKKSSYKKLAKFIKSIEKSGLVKTKEIRGETFIKSIDWSHKKLAEFKQEGQDKSAGPPAKKDKATAGGTSTAASQPSIAARELFKPVKGVIPIFEDMGVATTADAYFTRSDVVRLLNEYFQKHGLIDPQNPLMVKLDMLMCDGFLAKEDYQRKDRLPRNILCQKFIDKMQLYTAISLPDKQDHIIKGRADPVIVVEAKVGNKMTTRVLGLELYGLDPASIASDLKLICATSTTVRPITGGKKDQVEVFLQGKHERHVTKLLKEKGLPEKLIEIKSPSAKKVRQK